MQICNPDGMSNSLARSFAVMTFIVCVSCHTTTGQIVGRQHRAYLTGGMSTANGVMDQVGRMWKPLNQATWLGALAAIRTGFDAYEEVKLCGQCHRMPESIAPDRLKRYPNSVVRFQPVGLLQSRCYLDSGGTLSCTSCHDPHEPVHGRPDGWQIDSCRDCHSGSD